MARPTSALPLAPALTLSASEESFDDCPEEPLDPKPRKSRRKPGPTHKERLQDAQTCQKLLRQRCGGACRKGCLQKFKGKHLFEKLLAFRKELSGLHKLDADRLVPCLSLSTPFVFVIISCGSRSGNGAKGGSISH